MVLLLNTTVHLTTVSSLKKEKMIEASEILLEKYHQLVDSNNYYKDEDGKIINNLAIINDSYGSNEEIEVSPLLIEALKESINLSNLTQGYFNPTIGALSDLWSPLFSSLPIENSDPSQENIDKALACTISYQEIEDYLIIDEENNTVLFKKKGDCEAKVVIDLGAFSKGYITDKLYEELASFDSSFLFDAGSSSIITKAVEKEDIHWNIGVRSPIDSSTLYAFSCDNCAISTSADDQKYFLLKQDDGSYIIRHHILNPFTGYPENNYRGITLVASSNAGALDALSTALYNVKDETLQEEIIKNINEYYNINIQKALLSQNGEETKLEIDQELNDSILENYQINVTEIEVIK